MTTAISECEGDCYAAECAKSTSQNIRQRTLGVITAEDLGGVAGQEIVSVITKRSVETMGLQEGDSVVIVIKSTEVMLARNP